MKLFKNLFKKRETVEDRIKKLESRIFKKKEKKDTKWYFNSLMSFMGDWEPETLEARVDKIREDFEELDRKFDLLERYLNIEYFKVDEKTATYDWADKTSNEGFRKAKKTYQQMKKDKEGAKAKERDEYDY